MKNIQKTNNFKITCAGIIGNFLEWYEFALFGIFATLLANHFFPSIDPKTALIANFGVFAVGYLARPFGGAIVGYMGDKKSRRSALTMTLLVMGVVTTCIGLLPTYASIGLWSTVLLTLFRIIQGLAVGGEFPGSFVILTEQAKPNLRAFTASLSLVGALIGLLFGSGLANLLGRMLSPTELNQWGFRIPFLLGVILAVFGVYLRNKIWKKTTFAFTATAPLINLYRYNKLILAKAFFILSYGAALTGVLSIFLVSYLTEFLHVDKVTAYHTLFSSSIVMIISFPLSAWLSDYFKMHRLWLIIGLSVVGVSTYPLFLLMKTNAENCFIAVMLLSGITYFACGPFIPILVSIFPKDRRYTGVATMHGLSFSLIAGTSPLVLSELTTQWGTNAPSYYLIFFSLLALIAVCFSTSDTQHPL